MKMGEVAQNFCMTNDTAERGIKLITDFINILTQDDKQHQYLIQVVENHMKEIPDAKKSTLFKK